MTIERSGMRATEGIEVTRGLGCGPDQVEPEDQGKRSYEAAAMAAARGHLTNDARRQDNRDEGCAGCPDDVPCGTEACAALSAVLPPVLDPLPRERRGACGLALSDDDLRRVPEDDPGRLQAAVEL